MRMWKTELLALGRIFMSSSASGALAHKLLADAYILSATSDAPKRRAANATFATLVAILGSPLENAIAASALAAANRKDGLSLRPFETALFAFSCKRSQTRSQRLQPEYSASRISLSE